MTELKMDKENLERTIQEALNLIGNQLVLIADSKSTCPIGETWREVRFTLNDHEYTMAFDGDNYFSLHINSRSREEL